MKDCFEHYYATYGYDIDIHTYHELPFLTSCISGNLELAKWLIKLCEITNAGLIKIHSRNDNAFYESCKNGNLEVAKWLIELSKNKFYGEFTEDSYNYAFIKSCEYGHLEIAKLINEISMHKKICPLILQHRNNSAFINSCQEGHLETAKWLLEMSRTRKDVGIINIHVNNENAFTYSCVFNHLEVAKWLIEISEDKEIGKINIHENKERAFKISCYRKCHAVVRWLYLLDRGKFDIHYLNKHYNDIKSDNFLVRIIGSDYRNNDKLRKEYKYAYNNWKLRISASVICKTLIFYKSFLEKSYSPIVDGKGFLRTKNDFTNKKNLFT